MADELTLAQAIILGIVEGVTEFLPVSSTGHLIVAQRMLGIPTDTEQAKQAADAYAIAIQGGAILAVLGLYWKSVLRMAAGLAGRDREGRDLAVALLTAFLPAAVIGLAANSWIKQVLFGMWPVVVAWIAGGIALLVLARQPAPGDPADAGSLPVPTVRQALLIGLMQCVAMWPGTSRSLMAIVGGLVVGLGMRRAVEFSFLLGVLTLGAATAYDSLKHGTLMVESYGLTSLLVGAAAAALSAALAVKWLVGYLARRGLRNFGWYRIVIGVAVGIALAAGFLPS
jgi:undecaprenyl-diphosphatase